MAARTRKKKSASLAGRETYHVLGPSGEELAVKGPAGPLAPGALALVIAQRHAQDATEESTFTVERHALFGPTEVLYRVVRTEDGTIRTATV